MQALDISTMDGNTEEGIDGGRLPLKDGGHLGEFRWAGFLLQAVTQALELESLQRACLFDCVSDLLATHQPSKMQRAWPYALSDRVKGSTSATPLMGCGCL